MRLNQAFGSTLPIISKSVPVQPYQRLFCRHGIAALLQSSTAASLIVSSFAARNVITIVAALAVVQRAGTSRSACRADLVNEPFYAETYHSRR